MIWLYSFIFYIPLDFIKIFVRYLLSGEAWNQMIESKVKQERLVGATNLNLVKTSTATQDRQITTCL